MKTLVRQLFVALLGGIVAAGVMLAAGHVSRGPSIALAQSSATISGVDSPNADAARQINYQGQVFNPSTGAPMVNAPLNFSFRLYTDSAGANQIYREDKFIQTNAGGFFNTLIGDTAPFQGSFDINNIFNGQQLYLGVFIMNEALAPLQPITFVPYAFWADHAHHLDQYSASDFPKIVAYGVVNADGSYRSGQNFTSSRQTVEGESVYIIKSGDTSLTVDNYTTMVTPACGSPAIVGVGASKRSNSEIRDLIVDMWAPNGTSRRTCTFQFMIFQR